MKQEKWKALERTISREYGNIAGIVILQNGSTLYENYFNECTAANTLHVYSVTKSIVSLLVGIALDQGCLQSVRQNVLDFFPDYPVRRGEKVIRDVTLEHLLTMTAPFKPQSTPFKYIGYFMSTDWLQYSLDHLGGRRPIGKFKYATLIGPDIITGILAKATGQSVLAFAKENLFSPLGIRVEENVIFQTAKEQMAFNQAKNISGWVADPTGLNTAGWGLTLAPADMAKIGQLCLAGGRWEGRQILSSNWLRESMKEHSRWEKVKLSYGYLWWIIDPKEAVYAALGDSGNVIYINTRKNAVVAIASLAQRNAKDRIELIRKQIEPLLEDNA